MIAWLTALGVVLNAVVAVLTLFKVGTVQAQGIEHGKDLQATRETVGLLTATEQRRKWAADHPRGNP